MKLIPSRNPRNIIVLCILCAFLGACASTKWSAKESDQEQMVGDIAYLASDKLKGRTFGSEGEVKAGEYIANRFKLLGLKPMGDNGTYFQSFTVKNNNPHEVEFADVQQPGYLSGRNVIGYLDQGAPYTIIVGAHYDHLGMGTFGSLYVGDPAIHNGADDNASGTSTIMELAQRLIPYKEHNYLFIAFTGEENGLWGSNYFTKHATIDMSKVIAMINFDMVGRMSENKIAINGTGTSPSWPELIKAANVDSLDVTYGESGVGPSDHTSFYLIDIPAIHFFTGAHEDYHKPSDDIEKINADGMEKVANLATRILRGLGNNGEDKIEFTKTKDDDKDSSPKLEVTLGVVPDYLYDETGLRLDGVKEGHPAANAGLLKGDVIIKMGGEDIKDIYAYMKVLSSFHHGDKTNVVVLRNGKEMKFDIQF
ncbi:MAG TPA: M28 family peptidase [Saprospiraceae bacterium]|nr:M28 family peptidase [Saprospiraceae bacterium]